MAAGPVFNGANTSSTPSSDSAPAKKSFHNHSDSAINSLAKSGGLMGIAKKAAKSFQGSSGASKSPAIPDSILDGGL
jgi:hypothetical protein